MDETRFVKRPCSVENPWSKSSGVFVIRIGNVFFLPSVSSVKSTGWKHLNVFDSFRVCNHGSGHTVVSSKSTFWVFEIFHCPNTRECRKSAQSKTNQIEALIVKNSKFCRLMIKFKSTDSIIHPSRNQNALFYSQSHTHTHTPRSRKQNIYI